MRDLIGMYTKGGGFSYLISESDYYYYIYGEDIIGRPDGQFGIPSDQMDKLLADYPNDPRTWEEKLGLDPYSLGLNPVRVNVSAEYLEEYNLREATEEMSGTNDQYLGTGKTPGGQDEAVIDPFINPEEEPDLGYLQYDICTRPTQAKTSSEEEVEDVEIVEEIEIDHTSVGPQELPSGEEETDGESDHTSVGPDETTLDTEHVQEDQPVEPEPQPPVQEDEEKKNDGPDLDDGMEQ